MVIMINEVGQKYDDDDGGMSRHSPCTSGLFVMPQFE